MTVRERRARLLSVLLLASTLAAGIMLGLAWSARAPVADPPPATADADLAPEEAPAPEETPDEPEEREADGERPNRGPVIYQVGLDAAQRESVDRIIGHFRERTRSLNDEMRERYDREQSALFAATRDSLRAVLTADQIIRYDSLLALRYGGDRDREGGNRRQRRR